MTLHNKPAYLNLIISLYFILVLFSCGGSSAFKRGQKYDKLSNYDAAMQSYQEALDQDPENTQYRLYFERARFHAANTHFDKARRLKKLNRLEEALQEFQRVITIDPSNTLAEQETTAIVSMLKDRERKSEEKKKALTAPESVSPAQQFLPFIKLSGDIRRAYETLSKVGGINVIFAPDFKPSPSEVSLDLSNVTLTEALDLLSLMTKTYWSTIKENTILVAVDTQQTRQKYQEEIIKTFHVSNVSGQQELAQVTTALRSLLLMNKVAQIDSQNAIVVRDTPDKVAAAEKILRSIDKSKSEVIIEVLIIEVQRTIRKQLGVNPGIPNSIDFSTNSPTTQGSSTISVRDLATLNGGNFFLTIPSTMLGQLYTRGNGRVLQNPTLRASDGKLAKLRVGTQQPVSQGSFSTGIGGQPGFGGGGFTTFTTVDVGVTLDITPHVLLNRDISMNIKVALKTITGFETLGGNRYPVLANREIDHDIQLKEGESSIVGGIIQASDTVTVDGVAGLSKIPLLRYLFSTEDKSISENEVIIVITPRILRLPELIEEDMSLALLGSSNNPRFLGPRVQLVGETRKNKNSQPSLLKKTDGRPLVDITPALPGASSPLSSQPVPRLAFVKFNTLKNPIKMGTQFSLAVSIENAQNVHGLSFNLHFDPNMLQLVDIHSGEFLSGDSNSAALAQRPENNQGEAVVSMTRPPGSPGISGTGVLMNLIFKTIRPGTCSISFGSSSILRDSAQAILPARFSSAQVILK